MTSRLRGRRACRYAAGCSEKFAPRVGRDPGNMSLVLGYEMQQPVRLSNDGKFQPRSAVTTSPGRWRSGGTRFIHGKSTLVDLLCTPYSRTGPICQRCPPGLPHVNFSACECSRQDKLMRPTATVMEGRGSMMHVTFRQRPVELGLTDLDLTPRPSLRAYGFWLPPFLFPHFPTISKSCRRVDERGSSEHRG